MGLVECRLLLYFPMTLSLALFEFIHHQKIDNLPPLLNRTSQTDSGSQSCQISKPLDDSSLFVTCSGNIQLDIGIPLLVEHTTCTIGQTRHGTSQGMLQSSQQGNCSEMGQVLKIVLVSSLDSIEFIGMLVNTRL